MEALAIRAFTATTALGHGRDAQRDALRARRGGLRRNDFGEGPLPTWIGRVDGIEDSALPASLSAWECRNNRLAWLALQQDGLLPALDALVARHGAERIALVVGTSTSSIGASEEGYARATTAADGAPAMPEDLQRPIVHTPHSLGDFLQHATGLRGPCATVATACSSSAKVFAQAARLIQAGVVDAARDGLSLGEAGGFAILERMAPGEDAPLQLRGYGESSDAHHMSAPHPQGLGATLAMRDALARAGIDAAQVGYLNLHGTSTPANDAIEAHAVAALFPDRLHASSTKGWTGHTFGAAGIVESVFALLALERGLLPGILNSATPDPGCGPQIRFDNAQRDIAFAMNNSFGFGGNNCSLVFGTGGAA